MAEWLENEIIDGMKRLVALALPGHPPAETIQLTAAAWCEALESAGIDWQCDLDAPRLRAAFRLLMRTMDRWPAPKHLLEALPARPEPLKLAAPPATEADRERARVMLAGIAKKLRMNHGHESSSPGKLCTPETRR